MVRLAADAEVSFSACRSKLAEVLEKVIKAELIRDGWSLEKTHDLQSLRDALFMRGSDLDAEVKPLCDAMADVYFTDRYPGFDFDDPDWAPLREQIEKVTSLLTTVKGRVTGGGG